MKPIFYHLTIALGLVLIGMSPATGDAEDFYKGQTIRFIVGYAPGGGYDTYTRAIARHIGKFIPVQQGGPRRPYSGQLQ